MTRLLIVGTVLIVISVFLAIAGCDKEKIVESTEYIHDVEYIELPPDTVIQVDTVFTSDSVTIHTTDTVLVFDTVVQVDYIYDTVHVYDTVTNVIVDTVVNNQCAPNEYLALTALQYYCDLMVFDAINTEFGISGGWVLYLSAFQTQLTKKSSGVYDIYGYIDYWTPEWDGFYAFEYYWRMTYSGGDPANPLNWQMSEPPATVSGYQPGVRLVGDSELSQPARR